MFRWRAADSLIILRLTAIAARHGATAAQVALKWLLDQDGVAAIPKAGRTASQRENLAGARPDVGRRRIARLLRDCQKTSASSIRLMRRYGMWRSGIDLDS